MKLIKLLFVVLFISTSAYANAMSYKEGTHYEVLKQPVGTKKEVREFFSFYCPACFKFEPVIAEVKALLPAGVPFKKNHVDAMPGRDIEIEKALTKAMIIAEHFKIEDKIIPAIFNYIHVSRANFDNVKDIKNLFMINGVDGDKFDKAFANFSVNSKLKQMGNKTATLRGQGINSVPTLIIHGKYRPITKDLKTMDEYKALISYLISK